MKYFLGVFIRKLLHTRLLSAEREENSLYCLKNRKTKRDQVIRYVHILIYQYLAGYLDVIMVLIQIHSKFILKNDYQNVTGQSERLVESKPALLLLCFSARENESKFLVTDKMKILKHSF